MKKYYVILNNQQSGPFTIDELQQRNLNPSTPIWHEGLADWTTVSNLQEFSSKIGATPPPFITNNKKPQINNKRFIVIGLSSLLLFGIVFGGVLFYKNLERNKKFNIALDLIRNYDSLDVEAFKDLASQNHGKAAYFYGKHFLIIEDSIEANKYFEIAGKNGEPFYSQYGLASNQGTEYFNDWVKNNIKLITNVANDGDWYMQFKLAYIYANGLGVEKNEDSAFKYYKLSSDSNYVTALFNIAYSYGFGVKKDETKAFTIYKSLVDRGYTLANFFLAYMYEKGIGTSINFDEAIKCYKIGASRGDKYCQYNLGYNYYKGDGVKKDKKEGLKFLELAANQGLEKATNLIKVIKAEQERANYQQNSSSSSSSSEVHTCRYCNSSFTGYGYGYDSDGKVDIGYKGRGRTTEFLFGASYISTGDFCSRRCASEAYFYNVKQGGLLDL